MKVTIVDTWNDVHDLFEGSDEEILGSLKKRFPGLFLKDATLGLNEVLKSLDSSTVYAVSVDRESDVKEKFNDNDEILNMLNSQDPIEHKLAFKLSNFNKDHLKYILSSDDHRYLHNDVLAHELIDDEIYSHLFSLPDRADIQLEAINSLGVSTKHLEILYDMILSYPLNENNFSLLLAISKHPALSKILMYKIAFRNDFFDIDGVCKMVGKNSMTKELQNEIFNSNNDKLKLSLSKSSYLDPEVVIDQITKKMLSENEIDEKICANLLYNTLEERNAELLIHGAKSVTLKLDVLLNSPCVTPKIIDEVIGGGDYLLIGAALNNKNANGANFLRLMNTKDAKLKALLPFHTDLLGKL